MQFPVEATKSLVIALLETIPGARITHAAEQADVAMTTVYRWMRDDPEFMEQVEEVRRVAREKRLDKCEDVVETALEFGENQFQAAKYVLDNQGQARGFGKRGQQINIQQNMAMIKGYQFMV